MNRRNFILTGTALNGVMVVPNISNAQTTSSETINMFDTINDLVNVDPDTLDNKSYVIVKGFDDPEDIGGGIFYWLPNTINIVLDGIAMNSNISGSWYRYYDGPIHTSWVGIKPSGSLEVFDSAGVSSINLKRWNNLSNFCKTSIWELITPNKSNVVTNTIFVDSGVYDFSGGTLLVGQGVGVEGCGPGRSVLRFNQFSGTCIQVGDEGDRINQTSLESSFDIIKNISIVHFNLASTGTETGIAFDNTIRRCELNNVHVQGFNVNVDVNAFGMDIRSCFFSNGFTRNLKIGNQVNSMKVDSCRIDDQRNPNTGENVLIVSDPVGARSLVFSRCDIQRAQRVGLRAIGVSSIAIRDCFFEGNNRDNRYHPDIWIEGSSVRNVIIDGCYFTGTGRFNGTTSRAINLRSDITRNGRFQISNNQQSSNSQGIFAYFIDIDANTDLKLVEFNNLADAPNAISNQVNINRLS